MTDSSVCFGHGEREARQNKIKKISTTNIVRSLNETLRVLIKQGPVSVDTSLKEIEENYAGKLEWKVIEGGGVLSIPVEDSSLFFGMSDLSIKTAFSS